jgi:hypothetical protein
MAGPVTASGHDSVEGSHVIMISKPQAVTDVIKAAIANQASDFNHRVDEGLRGFVGAGRAST